MLFKVLFPCPILVGIVTGIAVIVSLCPVGTYSGPLALAGFALGAGLSLELALDVNVQALYRFWPMPMYNAAFTLFQVEVATLPEEQAAWEVLR